MKASPRLSALISEAVHILREGAAEARRPVILLSAGKDFTVLAHLPLRAFYPSRPPMPLLHVDSTWEFSELLAFRDAFASEHGFDLIVYANEEGRSRGLNPFEHGDLYTKVMCTAAISSNSDSIEGVVAEMAGSAMSERQGRVSDKGSLEAQKRQGYF